VREAPVALHRRHRPAGLDDQERGGSGGVHRLETSGQGLGPILAAFRCQTVPR
jgi:hypothetical protein